MTTAVPPAPASRSLRAVTAVVLLAVVVLAVAILRTTAAREHRLTLATGLASGPIEGFPGSTYSYGWVNPDGSPVRWNPCQPVRWVVNPAGAPPGALADLQAAMATVAEVTGIRFVRDGEVDEPASSPRAAYQPRRYGDRWAPLLISWANLQGSGLGADLGVAPDTVGVASPVAISRRGAPGVLVTGQIVLERDVVVSPGFATTRSQGAVMLHELSHALGLGHTPDNAQLLYEGGEPIGGPGELGPGDRAGLVSVGRTAGCLSVPKAQDLN